MSRPAPPGHEDGPRPGAVRIEEGEAWTETAGSAVAGPLRDAVTSDGKASLALAGGSTPEPVYRWLARSGPLPWERVDLFFGDERCVPPDDPASNYRMVRETLLEPLGADPQRVHRMQAERPDRDAAADDYAAVLPPRLTVLLLGIGPEGHTASLFPGSPALDERRRRVVPVSTPAKPPERLTVTPPVLEAARHVVVLARGDRKADAVRRALEGSWSPTACPAQLARRGTWILDPAAAALLTGRDGRPVS